VKPIKLLTKSILVRAEIYCNPFQNNVLKGREFWCPGDLIMKPVILSLLCAAFAISTAKAANLDTVADRVLGEPDFTTATPGHSSTQISTAYGLGVDRRTGRIYVADTTNNRVLSWPNAASFTNGETADKVFGQPDFLSNTPNNGGVSPSSLSAPRGVAVDDQSNLYVADTGNNRILVYRDPNTQDNVADFVIGQTSFSANGAAIPPTSSSLNFPRGMAIDSANNLYVADTGNNRVLEYDTPLGKGGVADRVFGQFGSFIVNVVNNNGANATGAPSASNLNGPYGVGVDSQQNVYVADTLNNRVLIYKTPLTTDTVADIVIGQNASNTSGTGSTSTTLNGPYRLVVDTASNLYVCDSNNNRVLEYTTPITGPTTGSAANMVFGQFGSFTVNVSNNNGSGVTGSPSASNLSTPYDVAVDAANNVYIMDTGNFRILGYDLPVPNIVPSQNSLFPSVIAEGSTNFSLRVDGAGFVQSSVVRINGVPRATTFINPARIEAAVLAADVATAGTATITVTTPPPGGGTSTLENLTIYTRASLDTTADRVLGQPNFATNSANTGGITARSMYFVVDMAIDPKTGRFWVADNGNNRVLSWPSAAAITDGQPADIVLGQPDFSSNIANYGGAAGAPTANSLSTPSGLVVDANGNLYVSDNGNNRVLFYQAPIVSGQSAIRVFGQTSFTSGMANAGGATPLANTLNFPLGLALDSKGNLYVADFGNSRVLVFFAPTTSDTTADFVFGQGGSFTTSVSALGASGLNSPASVALDSQDNVYISDFGNSRVLEYNTPLTTDAVADRVIGQNDFASGVANMGAGIGVGKATASSLCFPYGVAVTHAGDLYVADFFNHRVLEFDSPLTSDGVADHVFGQGNSFTNNVSNNGGVSNNSLSLPRAASLDSTGNLYIADNNNNRIMMYDKPVNHPPVVVSGITATPTAQYVGLPIQFGYMDTDPDADPLTYTWDFGDGAAGSGTATSHIYSTAGTFSVKVTASDGYGGTTTGTVQVVITAPNSPVFTSLAVASGPVATALNFPLTVLGTAPISISTTALPDGLAFSNNTISGTPSTAGIYPVTVTATNFAGTATQSLSIIITGNGVSFSNVDSDGDGFPDEIETALGFNPNDPTSTPFGGAPAGTPESLFVSQLSISLNFAKPGNDGLQAAGILAVPTGFQVSGAQVVVDIGGVVRSFTLDGKGSSPKGNDSIKIGIKAIKGVVPAQSPKFTIKFSKGNWQGLLLDEGLTNDTAANVPKTVPVIILFNKKIYKASVAQLYTAKKGSTGKTKIPPGGNSIGTR
jgi:sugar lactone lactonase YvrE